MSEREPYGFLNPDGSFHHVSRMEPQTETVTFVTPLTQPQRSFQEWGQIFSRRSEERRAFNAPEHVAISIDTVNPILLIPFGDTHIGAVDADYERLTWEVEHAAGTPGVYVLALGDLTDSFFWGRDAQDEQVGSFKEQNEFAMSAMRLFAQNKKLLAGWRGDHDAWSMATGEDIYQRFNRELGAHFLDGVSYISLTVGNQLYKISGAHQHSGFSIYNSAHAALRLYRDSGEGGDINITAHTHRKGYAEQPVKRYGGESETIHYLSIGAYKRSDRFLRKKGYSRLSDDQIGPQSIMLWPDKKQIRVYWDVKQGLEALEKERRVAA